jgi:hypothetical protein
MTFLLLTATGLSIIGLVVYGLRIELVYKIRTAALDVVYGRIQDILHEAGEQLLPDDKEALEAEIERQWAVFHQHSHGAMLLALTKWTFAHFYPELAAELAARNERSTLE